MTRRSDELMKNIEEFPMGKVWIQVRNEEIFFFLVSYGGGCLGWKTKRTGEE